MLQLPVTAGWFLHRNFLWFALVFTSYLICFFASNSSQVQNHKDLSKWRSDFYIRNAHNNEPLFKALKFIFALENGR